MGDSDWGVVDPAAGGPRQDPAPARSYPNPRVLIVEDESMWIDLYDRQLRGAGYRTTRAGNVAEGTRLLLTSGLAFDVALLDLRLPDGCGADLIQPLLERTPLCKSVVITGQHTPDPHALQRMGAFAYVRKPPRGRALLRAIGAALDFTLAWRSALGQTSGALAENEVDDGEERPGDLGAEPIAFDLPRAVARLQQLGVLTPTETRAAERLLWGDTNEQLSKNVRPGVRARRGPRRVRTTKHHVANLLRKIGASNRAALLGVLMADAGIRDPFSAVDEDDGGSESE